MRGRRPWLVALLLAMGLAACQRAERGATPAAGGGDQVASTAPAGAPGGAKAGDPRGQVFIDKGCVQCHKVSKLGVNGQEIGPDLSFAATDVRSRFGTDIESFLKNPTGTMQIVLSSQIKLTEKERESIAELLSEIGEEGGKKQ